MKRAFIERWALSIVEACKLGQPYEDSRVELKSEWPASDFKMARRLAGHANAARGNDILWLIGLRENGTTVDSGIHDVSEIMPQLEKHFDGIAPEVTDDIWIPVDDSNIYALLFDTSRRPYVINRTDSKDGNKDVPWRTTSRTQSATRSELLRLLVDRSSDISLEYINGTSYYQGYSKNGPADCVCDIRVYGNYEGDSPLYLPFHKCECELRFHIDAPWVPSRSLDLRSYRHGRIGGPTVASTNIIDSPSELIVHGPGMITVYCWFEPELIEYQLTQLECRITLRDNHDTVRNVSTVTIPFESGEHQGFFSRLPANLH
ncbi:MAG: hypothetical protein KDA31_13180 [Phycisphaerales bacterium]|nr:hypothetical protein [Phycisphaerales bacterium]MCB9835244.1 hypothetical protein [Phycisphaera sp.]